MRFSTTSSPQSHGTKEKSLDMLQWPLQHHGNHNNAVHLQTNKADNSQGLLVDKRSKQ
jgi:hypothetical protein